MNNLNSLAEKEISSVISENTEMKENITKMVERIKDLERNLAISSIKLEKVKNFFVKFFNFQNDILNFEVLLTERDIKIKKLKEKEEKLNKLIEDAKISVGIFESQFQNENNFFKDSRNQTNKNTSNDNNMISRKNEDQDTIL